MLASLIHCCSIQFLVKKEGFGGGGSRMLQFHQGQGDVTRLKASGRTLNITIGPGLPSSTSELWSQQEGDSLATKFAKYTLTSTVLMC